ncbi:MAG: hypothetical protein QM501_05920 [Gimesia sp.]
MTATDCCEGRVGVKWILMFERWLKAGDGCSNSGSYALKRGRNASIRYETLRTGDGYTGECLQNIATFMVLESTVFAVSSAQKTHLARDAYNAYWDTA